MSESSVLGQRIWQYRVRSPEDGAWWADVILREDGWFGAVSDWQKGNNGYAFRWGAAGPDFRRFLAQINPGYLHSKISAEEVIHRDRTELRCQLALFERFAEGDDPDFDEELLVAALDRLELDLDTSHVDGVVRWAAEELPGDDYHYFASLIAWEPEPMAWCFCTKVLPVLQAMIRTELDGEQPGEAA